MIGFSIYKIGLITLHMNFVTCLEVDIYPN